MTIIYVFNEAKVDDQHPLVAIFKKCENYYNLVQKKLFCSFRCTVKRPLSRCLLPPY